MPSTADERALVNFERTLSALRRSTATPITEPRDLSGTIKDFEMCYELSWKSLKKILALHGHETGSAREAFECAYQNGWIDEESVWLEMIKDRNLSVHTYNEALARSMVARIVNNYAPAFTALFSYLKTK